MSDEQENPVVDEGIEETNENEESPEEVNDGEEVDVGEVEVEMEEDEEDMGEDEPPPPPPEDFEDSDTEEEEGESLEGRILVQRGPYWIEDDEHREELMDWKEQGGENTDEDFEVTKVYMDYQPKHGPVCVEMGFVEEGEEDYLYSRVWTEQGKEFKKTKLSDVDKSWWRAMFNMKPSDSELLVAVDETFEDKFELQKVDITQNLLTQLRAIKRAVVDKKTYKVGIIYCADGQTEQTDILDNQEGSEAYEEFLKALGTEVSLFDFPGYTGGLDIGENLSTGKTMLSYEDGTGLRVAYHVSTLMEQGEHQVAKKRHIGNDIVLIAFVDGDQKLPTDVIKSKQIHCVVAVKPYQDEDGDWEYGIECANRDIVQPHEPYSPPFNMSAKEAAEWVREKFVAAEIATYQVGVYAKKAIRVKASKLNLVVKEELGIKK